MGICCSLSTLTSEDAKRLLRDPESGARSRPTHRVDLEKSWHGLHYLLTGSASEAPRPLGFLLEGGQPLSEDEEDMSPRVFTPDEVVELNIALSKITEQQLWGRFNPAAMEEVYPSIWEEPEEDLREEYLMYFRALQQFLAQASKDKLAILVDVG